MTDILVPDAVMDPSGMSRKARKALERAAGKLHMKQVGYMQLPIGTVYVAERREKDETYLVMGACRNCVFELYCHKHSSQQARIMAACERAKDLVIGEDA